MKENHASIQYVKISSKFNKLFIYIILCYILCPFPRFLENVVFRENGGIFFSFLHFYQSLHFLPYTSTIPKIYSVFYYPMKLGVQDPWKILEK